MFLLTPIIHTIECPITITQEAGWAPEIFWGYWVYKNLFRVSKPTKFPLFSSPLPSSYACSSLRFFLKNKENLDHAAANAAEHRVVHCASCWKPNFWSLQQLRPRNSTQNYVYTRKMHVSVLQLVWDSNILVLRNLRLSRHCGTAVVVFARLRSVKARSSFRFQTAELDKH